jgi:hypothetical protein
MKFKCTLPKVYLQFDDEIIENDNNKNRVCNSSNILSGIQKRNLNKR